MKTNFIFIQEVLPKSLDVKFPQIKTGRGCSFLSKPISEVDQLATLPLKPFQPKWFQALDPLFYFSAQTLDSFHPETILAEYSFFKKIYLALQSEDPSQISDLLKLFQSLTLPDTGVTIENISSISIVSDRSNLEISGLNSDSDHFDHSGHFGHSDQRPANFDYSLKSWIAETINPYLIPQLSDSHLSNLKYLHRWLSLTLLALIHDPDFIILERTWRSLHLVLKYLGDNPDIEVRVLLFETGNIEAAFNTLQEFLKLHEPYNTTTYVVIDPAISDSDFLQNIYNIKKTNLSEKILIFFNPDLTCLSLDFLATMSTENLIPVFPEFLLRHPYSEFGNTVKLEDFCFDELTLIRKQLIAKEISSSSNFWLWGGSAVLAAIQVCCRNNEIFILPYFEVESTLFDSTLDIVLAYPLRYFFSLANIRELLQYEFYFFLMENEAGKIRLPAFGANVL